MTVSNEKFRTLQDADGIQTVFNFDFHIQGADATDWDSQIVVYENGVVTIITYVISNVTPAGGTITFNTAPSVPAGSAVGKVAMVRRKPNVQGSQYPIGNPFPPIAVESSLDDLTLQAQDVEAIGEFGVRQPEWEEKRTMVLPDIDTRALRPIVFDQDGNVDVSDLVAVPIAILNCTVNINAPPYNVVAGEADSTIQIQAALNSGASYITGCPGIYNVRQLVQPNNTRFHIPGGTLNGIGPAEDNSYIFGVQGNAITAENIHLEVESITGFIGIIVANYKNVSIVNTIIDGVFGGLTIGKHLNTTSGLHDSFKMSDVIIRNSPNGAINPASGTGKEMSIAFDNVGVELCGGRPVDFGAVNGYWNGGFVKDNTVGSLRGAMEFNASYPSRGFGLNGVRFDNNGNASLDSLDIFVGSCNGLSIDNCTFEKTLAANGRGWAVGTSSGSGVSGLSMKSNHIIATPSDSTSFIAIQAQVGSVNGFYAANHITGLTGGQLGEVIDTTFNYHILNGVKQ